MIIWIYTVLNYNQKIFYDLIIILNLRKLSKSISNLNPKASHVNREKGLAHSKTSKNLFYIINQILSELKLKRPNTKL